jgi:hypothetical protein
VDSSVAEIVIAFITGIVGPIVLMWAKKKFEERKSHDPILKEIEVNSIIDTEIDNLLFEIECDRVWMAQFHNGGHFYPTGKSIQKFSIFYESTSIGTSRITPQFQNIPCSLFTKTFKDLLTNHVLIIDDFTDPKKYGQNTSLRDAAETTGCQSIMLVPVLTLDSKVIGVLGIEFVKSKKEFTEEEKASIRESAALLSGVLIQYLKTK